ncbi:MAG: hypothetical protein JNK48_05585 [Bryobacterales bacterium]|nr:hypothetical protein [Bryobacterales bacterium]
MQFRGQGKPAVGVIFDAAIGQRIGDILAMAVLYGLDGKNECRVVSVSTSKSHLKSAALAEVIGRFYAGAVSGAFGAVGRTLPVGLSTDGNLSAETPMMKAVLERTSPDGKPAYNHGIQHLNDTAEVPALIRNAFTSQFDQNAVVVLAGPATNLAAVLAVKGARDWIAQKVRQLVWVATEETVREDLPAARRVAAEWPGDVVIVPPAVGDAVLFPAASIEKDFAWSKDHPIADAYRAFRPMPYDAPMHAAAAVLYAVRPAQPFFTASDPGALEIAGNGAIQFRAAPAGKHRILRLNPDKNNDLLATYIELASAKPVPRVSRFRPPVAETKKADPTKPAEKKP